MAYVTESGDFFPVVRSKIDGKCGGSNLASVKLGVIEVLTVCFCIWLFFYNINLTI